MMNVTDDKLYHDCQCIEEALGTWRMRNWHDALQVFKKPDGTQFRSWQELKVEFFEALHKDGVKFVEVEKCPEFNPHKGCPGHSVKEQPTWHDSVIVPQDEKARKEAALAAASVAAETKPRKKKHEQNKSAVDTATS